MKIMHAINNGPKKPMAVQCRGNFNEWVEAEIPYSRNHDASSGNEHIVDVWSIFPNPDADVNDPASYDFQLTDEYIQNILEAGTKIFYRLGNKIEHWSKKYGTLPPKDFKKWAEICEHIIMHYNEGWADGFRYNIEYWEIWNEPDMHDDEDVHKETWGGTKAQFFDFYEIAAKHLKNRFPHLKIGGPALSHRVDWAEDFIVEMRKRNVPLDFFSWHRYCPEPDWMLTRQEKLKKILDDNGYADVETICNEWNYIKGGTGWTTDFVYSIQTIISMKGAAFTASCMLAAQHSTVDMLMYYDARLCAFNGLFDFYTCQPLKTYYVFTMFRDVYKLGTSYDVEISDNDIYCVAAKNGEDEAIMISFYNDNDEDNSIKTIDLDINGKEEYDLYILDEDHNYEKVGAYKKGTPLNIKHNTVIMLK
ncbi:MAG: hypothetical protein IJM97_05260 [Clostridia bacterium]|nr:hypothetical protein [Clostridia bacterium]